MFNKPIKQKKKKNTRKEVKKKAINFTTKANNGASLILLIVKSQVKEFCLKFEVNSPSLNDKRVKWQKKGTWLPNTQMQRKKGTLNFISGALGSSQEASHLTKC